MPPTLNLPHQLLAQALGQKFPEPTVTALMAHPEIAAELLPVIQLSPLPVDYVPRDIQVLFDDVTVLHWQDGQGQYSLHIATDYQPDLIEWVLDGETAYFSIHGQTVINRLQLLPQLDLDTLNILEDILCKLS